MSKKGFRKHRKVKFLTKNHGSAKMIKKFVATSKVRICPVERKSQQMDSNFIFKEIVNFLLCKFADASICGKPLFCSRTKIGKLLFILQILWFKCKGEFAFSERIVRDTCGCSIPELSILMYPYIIYGSMQENPSECYIKNESLCSEQIMIEVKDDFHKRYPYNDVNCVGLSEMIQSVFLNFGSYQSSKLGALIDEFKDAIFEDADLNKEKLQRWLNTLAKAETQNDIIIFLRQYENTNVFLGG